MNVFTTMALTLGVAIVALTVVFGIAVARGRYDTVDTAWGQSLA